MKKKISIILRSAFATWLALCLAASPIWAGPPLICHAFDIGSARSLPWVSHDWNLSGAETYDTNNLSKDTLEILASSQVTLVHMETLRRATLYARKDREAAKKLLLVLTARAEASERSARPDALAVFDAGYLAETYEQWLGEGAKNPASGMDGYAVVESALRLRAGDAQMEFAAALIALRYPPGQRLEHAKKAVAGSKADELLARNLDYRFLGQRQTMREMILQDPEVKAAKQ